MGLVRPVDEACTLSVIFTSDRFVVAHHASFIDVFVASLLVCCMMLPKPFSSKAVLPMIRECMAELLQGVVRCRQMPLLSAVHYHIPSSRHRAGTAYQVAATLQMNPRTAVDPLQSFITKLSCSWRDGEIILFLVCHAACEQLKSLQQRPAVRHSTEGSVLVSAACVRLGARIAVTTSYEVLPGHPSNTVLLVASAFSTW
jgi:hypothetical protein